MILPKNLKEVLNQQNNKLAIVGTGVLVVLITGMLCYYYAAPEDLGANLWADLGFSKVWSDVSDTTQQQTQLTTTNRVLDKQSTTCGEGSTKSVTCGNGVQIQQCINQQWTNVGQCIDSTNSSSTKYSTSSQKCSVGATQYVQCSESSGAQLQKCDANGTWKNDGKCVAAKTESNTTATKFSDIVRCFSKIKEFSPATGEDYQVACNLAATRPYDRSYIGAFVVKDAFDPKTGVKDENIIKVIHEEQSHAPGSVNYWWDGNDDYDQVVADGEYTLVVQARQDYDYKYDYSLIKFKIATKTAGTEENSGTQVNDQLTNQAGTQTGNGNGSVKDNTSGALDSTEKVDTNNTASKLQVDKEIETVGASKCPGINYPNDISKHWAVAEIKDAYDNCIIAGYKDGTFKPDSVISRAEALKAIMMGFKLQPITNCANASCGSSFKDLQAWQGPWVKAGEILNIVSKDKAGKFYPNRSLTRAEGAALLAKALNAAHPGYLKFRTDCYTANCGAGYPSNMFMDITQMWQGPYLRALWDKKIINGTAPYSFEPERAMTRAELIKLLMNARNLQIFPTDNVTKTTDKASTKSVIQAVEISPKK